MIDVYNLLGGNHHFALNQQRSEYTIFLFMKINGQFNGTDEMRCSLETEAITRIRKDTKIHACKETCRTCESHPILQN